MGLTHMDLKAYIQQLSDSHSEGYLLYGSIKNAEAAIEMTGVPFMGGVEPTRMVDLAAAVVYKDAGRQNPPQDVIRVDEVKSINLLRKILEKGIAGGSYTFIKKESICKQSVRDILSQINQWRTGCELPSVQKNQKLLELEQLKDVYESYLKNKNLYDDTRMIAEALTILTGNQAQSVTTVETETVAVVDFAFETLTYLEREFLNKFTGGKGPIIIDTPVNNHTDVTFFKGYGIINEIRHVLSDIQKKKYPYGDVAILYSHDAYNPHLISELECERLPYRDLGGHSIASYDKIRLFSKLLDFAESDFSYEMLKPVIMDSAFYYNYSNNENSKENATDGNAAEPKEDSTHHLWIQNIFLKSTRLDIGQGRERYREVFNQQIEKLEEKKKNNNNVTQFDAGQVEFLGLLCKIVDAFSGNPDGPMVRPDGSMARSNETTARPNESMVRPDVIVLHLESLLKDIATKTETKLQNGIAKVIFADLRKYLSDEEEMELPSAIQAIREEMESMRVRDAKSPADIMIAKVPSPVVCNRKYIYIMGLSNAYMIQNAVQSPSINDDELCGLLDKSQGFVRLSGEDGERKSKGIKKTIDMLDGDSVIAISASIYDSFSIREDYPSPLFESLRTQYAPGINIKIYDYEEAARPGISFQNPNQRQYVEDAFSDHAKKKLEARQDGADISPSAFQTIMACPKQYYYEYLLNLPKEEYREYSPDEWLNPAKKGTLFHDTMQMYMEDVIIGKPKNTIANKPDDVKFQECFKKAVDELRKTTCPHMEPAVEAAELNEIKEMCKAYLTKFHQEAANDPYEVIGCEVDVQELNRGGGIEIEIPDDTPGALPGTTIQKTMKITGRIDRLDAYKDGNGITHYRIIDYKTGSLSKMENNLIDGRELQHALYTMALETAPGVSPQIVVDEAQYVFPGELMEDPQAEYIIRKAGGDLKLDDFFLNIYQDACDDGFLQRGDYYNADLPMEDICQYCSYGKNDICLSYVKKEEK